MTREDVIARLQSYFSESPSDIIAVYLFGSVARRQDRSDSDVDVGVLFATAPASLANLDRIASMQSELTQTLGREVDLVPLNGAPPDLLHRMLLDRVLVFEGDHDERIEFEVRARNEYFDIAPNLERYRREVLRRVGPGRSTP